MASGFWRIWSPLLIVATLTGFETVETQWLATDCDPAKYLYKTVLEVLMSATISFAENLRKSCEGTKMGGFCHVLSRENRPSTSEGKFRSVYLVSVLWGVEFRNLTARLANMSHAAVWKREEARHPCGNEVDRCQTKRGEYSANKVREFSNDGRPSAIVEAAHFLFYGSTCQPDSPSRW